MPQEPNDDALIAQIEAARAGNRPPAEAQADGTPEPTEEAAKAEREASGAANEDAPKAEGDDEAKKGEVPHKSWAAMFRREKRARELEASNKSMLERAQTLEKEAQERISKAEAKLKELETDPYGYVEKHINFDEWAKRRMTQKPPSAEDRVKALEAEVERLRHEPKKLIEEQTKAQQQAQLESTVQQWIEHVPIVLKDDKYALIRDMGAQDEVAALAAMELQRSGKWLTQVQAADRILVAAQQRLAQLAKGGHVRMGAANEDPPAEPEPEDPQGAPKQKRNRPARPARPLTRQEEIAELAKQLRYHE